MTNTESELATLLLKDRVLLANLLFQDAQALEDSASVIEDHPGNKEYVAIYRRRAASRTELAQKIVSLDSQITNEFINAQSAG